MKFFSKLKKTAQRATYFDDLKEETVLIKNSAESLINSVKEVNQEEKKANQSPKKFSEINPEDIAYSSRMYTRLLGLFIGLDVLGLIYLIYTLAKHSWMTALSVVFFLIICGALSFRFHFLLMVIKQKNLQLTLLQYLAQWFNKTKSS